MKRILSIALLLTTSAAAAEAPFDARRSGTETLEHVASLNQTPALFRFEMTDDPRLDGVTGDSVVRLARTSLDAIRSQAELDGVLATMIAFADTSTARGPAARTKPTVGQYLALAAYSAAGEATDPLVRSRSTANGARYYERNDERRRYTFPGVVAAPNESGTALGRASLILMTKAGTCSGATLAAFDRLQRRYSDLPAEQRPPLSLLAGRLRGQLGAAANPPDMSCVP